MSSSTGGGEEEEKDKDGSFSPLTKMRIVRLLKKQGDTKAALRLQYEVMNTEAVEDGAGTLTSKERTASLHDEQGDVKEALQIRCEILLAAIKELQEKQSHTLTTRKQISERCAGLRPVSDSLSMIQKLVHKFRKLSINDKSGILGMMQEIGRKLLTERWRLSGFEMIQHNTKTFGSRDAKTIATLCIADVMPSKNMPMDALLGYVEVYKELGRFHFLATYITCAIVKCVVTLVTPFPGNRPLDIVDTSSDHEVVSLTDKCCGLIIGLFSMVSMNDNEQFWSKWEKFDDCRIECLRVLEIIPCPLPESESECEGEMKEEVEEQLSNPNILIELDEALEDVYPEAESLIELQSKPKSVSLKCFDESKESNVPKVGGLDDSFFGVIDKQGIIDEASVEKNIDLPVESDDTRTLLHRYKNFQRENEVLCQKLIEMQVLLALKTEESALLSRENNKLWQQLKSMESDQEVLDNSIKAVEKSIRQSIIQDHNNVENVQHMIDDAEKNIKSVKSNVRLIETDIKFQDDESNFQSTENNMNHSKENLETGRLERVVPELRSLTELGVALDNKYIEPETLAKLESDPKPALKVVEDNFKNYHNKNSASSTKNNVDLLDSDVISVECNVDILESDITPQTGMNIMETSKTNTRPAIQKELLPEPESLTEFQSVSEGVQLDIEPQPVLEDVQNNRETADKDVKRYPMENKEIHSENNVTLQMNDLKYGENAVETPENCINFHFESNTDSSKRNSTTRLEEMLSEPELITDLDSAPEIIYPKPETVKEAESSLKTILKVIKQCPDKNIESPIKSDSPEENDFEYFESNTDAQATESNMNNSKENFELTRLGMLPEQEFLTEGSVLDYVYPESKKLEEFESDPSSELNGIEDNLKLYTDENNAVSIGNDGMHINSNMKSAEYGTESVESSIIHQPTESIVEEWKENMKPVPEKFEEPLPETLTELESAADEVYPKPITLVERELEPEPVLRDGASSTNLCANENNVSSFECYGIVFANDIKTGTIDVESLESIKNLRAAECNKNPSVEKIEPPVVDELLPERKLLTELNLIPETLDQLKSYPKPLAKELENNVQTDSEGNNFVIDSNIRCVENGVEAVESINETSKMNANPVELKDLLPEAEPIEELDSIPHKMFPQPETLDPDQVPKDGDNNFQFPDNHFKAYNRENDAKSTENNALSDSSARSVENDGISTSSNILLGHESNMQAVTRNHEPIELEVGFPQEEPLLELESVPQDVNSEPKLVPKPKKSVKSAYDDVLSELKETNERYAGNDTNEFDKTDIEFIENYIAHQPPEKNMKPIKTSGNLEEEQLPMLELLADLESTVDYENVTGDLESEADLMLNDDENDIKYVDGKRTKLIERNSGSPEDIEKCHENIVTPVENTEKLVENYVSQPPDEKVQKKVKYLKNHGENSENVEYAKSNLISPVEENIDSVADKDERNGKKQSCHCVVQ